MLDHFFLYFSRSKTLWACYMNCICVILPLNHFTYSWNKATKWNISSGLHLSIKRLNFTFCETLFFCCFSCLISHCNLDNRWEPGEYLFAIVLMVENEAGTCSCTQSSAYLCIHVENIWVCVPSQFCQRTIFQYESCAVFKTWGPWTSVPLLGMLACKYKYKIKPIGRNFKGQKRITHCCP